MKKDNELTAEQYHICRECGTEPPFSGKYNLYMEEGVYHCICCDAPLFKSEHKFISKSGWPSFFAPYDEQAIKELTDYSISYMPRIEIRCSNCDAHLGHVFEDGPEPTGLRYCVNSISLNLHKK
jgi:peptide-methionine (R)-S-oxide reductase